MNTNLHKSDAGWTRLQVRTENGKRARKSHAAMVRNTRATVRNSKPVTVED